MTTLARTQHAPAPDIGGEQAYRRRLADGGRVHIDRALPFLLLARHPDAPFSLARRVATISAASMVWPETAADASTQNGEPALQLAAVVAALQRDFPRFLLIHLHDLPRDASLDPDSPRLEPFVFSIASSADAQAREATSALENALATTEIDLRSPKFRHDVHAPTMDWVAAADTLHEGISHISLGIPQIHRIPGQARRVYPQIYHELEVRIADALLQAVARFIELTTPDGDGDGVPGGRPHHRSFGRRRFVQAALRADRALARISASFDFLLGISPINSAQAYADFETGGRRAMPDFRYRPLSINPVVAKRKLHAIDLRAVEDPVLEEIFSEKRIEIDQQLTMLQRRNTPAFRYVSLLQYGAVETELLTMAQSLLAMPAPSAVPGDATRVGAEGLLRQARDMLAMYSKRAAPFAVADATVRTDTSPGLMVTGSSVLISADSSVPQHRVDPLLQHEISVHVLTCINGNQQPLAIFGSGLARYEGLQEGLGVFAEFLVGGLTASRLRLIAARVVVVQAMLADADFVSCHRLLLEQYGFGSRSAFNIVARVFRSGGLTKDAIYLRGLLEVLGWAAQGKSLSPFWCGKIALHHIPVVEELQARGMLLPAMVQPEFIEREIARTTLARLRNGEHFIDILGNPST